MNELSNQLNRFLVGEELVKELTVLPDYKEDLESVNDRLLALLDIYKIYVPTKDTLDIYNRLYLSIVSSLEKKNTIEEVRLLNKNYQVNKGLYKYGIIGGLDSYLITGPAGIGKTSCVQRCIEVISKNNIIKSKSSIREIIPILMIECVADGSFKSLLYSILDEVDRKLGTTYLATNKHTTTTIDSLLSATSNVLINHVGLLVIDEIERVANDSRKGETLINYLTQLVNQSNISICFVGNGSVMNYFSSKEYLARRSIGININKLKYDDYFYSFLKILFKYQYLQNKVQLDGELGRIFYKYSGGNIALVVSLFVEVQRYGLLMNHKEINKHLIDYVFNNNFRNMISYIDEVNVVEKKIKDDDLKLKNSNVRDEKDLFKTLIKKYKNINEFVNELSNLVLVEYV